jgi:hypothetical protein
MTEDKKKVSLEFIESGKVMEFGEDQAKQYLASGQWCEPGKNPKKKDQEKDEAKASHASHMHGSSSEHPDKKK